MYIWHHRRLPRRAVLRRSSARARQPGCQGAPHAPADAAVRRSLARNGAAEPRPTAAPHTMCASAKPQTGRCHPLRQQMSGGGRPWRGLERPVHPVQTRPRGLGCR
eukprot:scaffold8611_cov108-Isochrysis_galbana.AAC.11